MIELFQSKLLTDAGFPDHGFTGRRDGAGSGPFASANLAYGVGDDPNVVARNLAALRNQLAHGKPLLRMVQVHGIEVVEADSTAAPLDPAWTAEPTFEADGVIVPDGLATAAVQTADCAPVLLADPASRIVAAIHAGWRGAAKGILRVAVRQLAARGAEPGRLLAAIGPCICGGCYQVGPEVGRHFPESVDPDPEAPGKLLLDLGLAVEVSLIGAGLTSVNIERIGACNSCLPEQLFSHRGSGGNCGRGLAFITS